MIFLSNWFKKRRDQKRKELELIISWATNDACRNIVHDLIASIGLQNLKKIVEQGEKNSKEFGHHNYTNLADLYFQIIKSKK